MNHNEFPVFSLRSLLHDLVKIRQEMNFALILLSTHSDSSANWLEVFVKHLPAKKIGVLCQEPERQTLNSTMSNY